MFKKVLPGLAAAVVLTAGANAATVSIVAPDKVVEGDTFEIQIFGDFGNDGLLAGGLQLLYDSSLLSIEFIQFDLGVDPDLSCPGAGLCPVDPAGTISIVWGQFLADLIPAGAGPTLMATLQAVALPGILGAGGTDLTLLDFSAFTGGWFGAGFVTIATPEFLGTTIMSNPIPLPAAVWLMIGGLGALARFRRSK